MATSGPAEMGADGPPAPPAVIAAQREELAPLLRIVTDVGRLPCSGPGRFFTARLIQPLVLGWTGDGRRAARAGLEALLARHPVSRLLVLGIAGGLSEGLAFGHLVAAREVRDADGLAPAPDGAWIERATNLPGVREAVVCSHERILSAAADKDALGRRVLDESEARTGAAVVDIETATYARAAAAHGLPYTAIRAVSDAVDEDLPFDFSRFCDADGHVRRGRVVVHALARPWLIVRLVGLRARLATCARRLSDAAIFVLLSGSPTGR